MYLYQYISTLGYLYAIIWCIYIKISSFDSRLSRNFIYPHLPVSTRSWTVLNRWLTKISDKVRLVGKLSFLIINIACKIYRSTYNGRVVTCNFIQNLRVWNTSRFNWVIIYYYLTWKFILIHMWNFNIQVYYKHTKSKRPRRIFKIFIGLQ